MSKLRHPLPRKAKSAHAQNDSMDCKRPKEGNEIDSVHSKIDSEHSMQISAMRLVNDTLSCNINILNDELIKRNDDLKNKDKFILKKIKYTNEILKSNKALKDKLSESEKSIADLKNDLDIANERIKSMELTINTNTHSRNINGKVKGNIVVEFKRNIISYILTDDDPEGVLFIDMMIKKCKLILGEYPKDFYIKTLNGNKQFVFGCLEVAREVDVNTSCIICKQKFRDTHHGKIVRVPYGVTLLNTKTTIDVGAFCGYHKWAEDGQTTPLNFMVKKGTFDCIL